MQVVLLSLVVACCCLGYAATFQHPKSICTRAIGTPASGHETSLDMLFAAYNLPLDWHFGNKRVSLAELVLAVDVAAAGAHHGTARITTDPPPAPDPATWQAVNGTFRPHGATIPLLIHMTVRDPTSLSSTQALSIGSWALLNPRHTLHVWTDALMKQFMATHHPDLLAAYDALSSPVERTDMWRYAVVCTHGGFYADADTLAAQPIDAWPLTGTRSWGQLQYRSGSYVDGWSSLYNVTCERRTPVSALVAEPHVGALVGFESHAVTQAEAEAAGFVRPYQVIQWALGGKPGHPLMCEMGGRIRGFAAREAAGEFKSKGWSDVRTVLERTGPGAWRDGVAEVVRVASVQGGPGSPDLAAFAPHGGDVWEAGSSPGGGSPLLRLLPLPAMGCPTILAQFSRWARPPPVLLYHMFAGSWKPEDDVTKVVVNATGRQVMSRPAQVQPAGLWSLLRGE